MSEVTDFKIIAESTSPPVALFDFIDGTKIRVVITRSMNYEYDIIYSEALSIYRTLKRKDKIKKILGKI